MKLYELGLKLDNLLGIAPTSRYTHVSKELATRLFKCESVEVRGVSYVGEKEVITEDDYSKASRFGVYLRFDPVAFPINVPSFWIADFTVKSNADKLASLLKELKQYNETKN